ncbi:uncharacterized protein LOC117113621 [Anneissia japonica]|uniref:uncharacterized protein LOC117113621 n=1 Tax=Anneissia japonica TaxID=1529436 RepID=UPI001425B212|nr:uncharacterized protein LOC117113621 [Anneissia japonica]
MRHKLPKECRRPSSFLGDYETTAITGTWNPSFTVADRQGMQGIEGTWGPTKCFQSFGNKNKNKYKNSSEALGSAPCAVISFSVCRHFGIYIRIGLSCCTLSCLEFPHCFAILPTDTY